MHNNAWFDCVRLRLSYALPAFVRFFICLCRRLLAASKDNKFISLTV